VYAKEIIHIPGHIQTAKETLRIMFIP
jgi:hypothetical protein